jgi:hypothetical protein
MKMEVFRGGGYCEKNISARKCVRQNTFHSKSARWMNNAPLLGQKNLIRFRHDLDLFVAAHFKPDVNWCSRVWMPRGSGGGVDDESVRCSD